MKGKRIPETIFNVRVRDESIEGDNPYRWQNVSSNDIFRNKTILLFSLPGAFTPTCSTYQLPDFEKMFSDFKSKGVDEIYCLSVNDSFVMNAWGRSQKLEHVKLIPDGNGEFTLDFKGEPLEPYGFSLNPEKNYQEAIFEDIAFDMQKFELVEIKLK